MVAINSEAQSQRTKLVEKHIHEGSATKNVREAGRHQSNRSDNR
jgi:hypothetical protein